MSYTYHILNDNLAQKYNLATAGIFTHLSRWLSWIQRKKISENKHQGQYWVYKTHQNLVEETGFSIDQIRYAIEKLIDADYIKVGNFSYGQYHKTNWYALGQTGKKEAPNWIADRKTGQLKVKGLKCSMSMWEFPQIVSGKSPTSMWEKSRNIYNVKKGIKQKGDSALTGGGDHQNSLETSLAPSGLMDLLDQSNNSKQIAEVISYFSPFHPNIGELYCRKPEREAAEKLLERYGLEGMRSIVGAMVMAWQNGDPFVPKTYSPWLFWEKLADVQDWVKRTKNKQNYREKTPGFIRI